MDSDKPKRHKFKRYHIGYFHIDIAEVRTEYGKLYLFVAIDGTGKFAVTQLVDKANRKTAREVLDRLLEVVPYKIYKILTPSRDTSFGNTLVGNGQRGPACRAASKP